ncbi:DUF3592 domain-containing protein [Deefgea tanakiae]|uniref:DUF3592 domain-containing protein n=1 Tax=Deefgea tanakiae TaxID=2865840 RepID=A0ABX8Z7P3_9NEIS|nr:DUF3592 domain-containing protein [Deefgea tanakiae]QZA78583.1 DUF3592 domain-containing protein [Deefgea tanakiae]
MSMPNESSSQIRRLGNAYLGIVVYLQIGLGLLLLVLAYHTGLERLTLLWHGQTTVGQIVRYIEVEPEHSSEPTWFKAIVIFAHDDRQIEFADWNSSEYSAGVPEQVEVLFNPQQPSQAMIHRANVLDWMPWAPFGLLGVFLLLVGLLGLGRSQRLSENN